MVHRFGRFGSRHRTSTLRGHAGGSKAEDRCIVPVGVDRLRCLVPPARAAVEVIADAAGSGPQPGLARPLAPPGRPTTWLISARASRPGTPGHPPPAQFPARPPLGGGCGCRWLSNRAGERLHRIGGKATGKVDPWSALRVPFSRRHAQPDASPDAAHPPMGPGPPRPRSVPARSQGCAGGDIRAYTHREIERRKIAKVGTRGAERKKAAFISRRECRLEPERFLRWGRALGWKPAVVADKSARSIRTLVLMITI